LLLNASISAALAPPGFGAYGASKAAVEALGNVLRQETRHLGVDVGVCYFGFIDTDLVGTANAVYPAFRLMKENLPPPAGMLVPLSTAVEAAIRAWSDAPHGWWRRGRCTSSSGFAGSSRGWRRGGRRASCPSSSA